MNVFGELLPSLVPGFLSGLTLLLLTPYLVLESGIRRSASTNADIAQKLSAESPSREALLNTVNDQVELLAAYAHYPAMTRNDLLKSLSAALFLGLAALAVFKTPTNTQEEYETAWAMMAMLSGVPALLLMWMGVDRAARAHRRTALLKKRAILHRALVQAWISQAPAVQMMGALITGAVAALFGYFLAGAVVIDRQGLKPTDEWSLEASLIVFGALLGAWTIGAAFLFLKFFVPSESLSEAVDPDGLVGADENPELRRGSAAFALLIIAAAFLMRRTRR
jgi:hypothetical protein